VKVVANMPNVTILEKEPSRVVVRIEPVMKKNLPIRVRFDGEAKSGFVPGEVTVNPESATVQGAKSLVESLGEVTALVKLAGEEEDFRKTVVLAAYDEKGEKIQGLVFDPQTAEVTVPIVPASEGKTVGIKVKTRGKPKSEYYVSKIEVSPATVEIFGAASTLKPILFLETKEVYIEGIDKDTEKEVDLAVPSGVRVNDSKVIVKISLSSNVVSREITANVNYQNLGTGLRVQSLSPAMIKTIVSCPITVLNTLTSDQVVLNLDLSGKAAGNYYLDIHKDMFSLPAECVLNAWLPSATTITIE
jgi:YbbR domain-containing protein